MVNVTASTLVKLYDFIPHSRLLFNKPVVPEWFLNKFIDSWDDAPSFTRPLPTQKN